jgi:uncharacterized repeat protein (TIGR03803 family)
MKKLIVTIFCLLSNMLLERGFAQNQFWGVTSSGGPSNRGVIFKTNIDGTGYSIERSIMIDVDAEKPAGSLVEAPNGKLYGMTKYGGANGQGVLFEFDPIKRIYTKKIDFSLTETGAYPDGTLMLASNGKLYGMTGSGGINNGGVIFEYEIATGILTKKFDFKYSVSGSGPVGSLIQASNGKLYGMTSAGGSLFWGVIFEFDLSSSSYFKKYEFNGLRGETPRGDLVEAPNGKLYGVTQRGGLNNKGVIFEYDPLTEQTVKKMDFNGTANGANPYGNLIVMANKLYGMTYAGGTNDKGVIFEFNQSDGIYIKKFDFDGVNGANPYGSLVQASNGKMYGMTNFGGSLNKGVIFEFDLSNGSYKKTYDFDKTNGANPFGNLVNFKNGKLYGMTYYGGVNYDSYLNGVLFEFNPLENAYTKVVDFNNKKCCLVDNGNSLMQADNGRLYGLTLGSGIVSGFEKEIIGTISEFDIKQGSSTKIFDFTESTDGDDPQGKLVQATNRKLYGVANTGGASNNGVIFEYDISLRIFKKIFDLTFSKGSEPHDLIQANNGNLYGMTRSGGANSKGVIFEYNIQNGIYVSLFDFGGQNGANPVGRLIQASNGKLYGLTFQGGDTRVNILGNGVLFEFDPSNGSFVKKIDFSGVNGSNPLGSLIQASNGKLYGMTSRGGLNDKGTIFEYDLTTGQLLSKYSFNGTNGSSPISNLVESPNGKLYGLAKTGGLNDYGALFEYDQSLGIFNKKFDFNSIDGVYPVGELLLVNTKDNQVITFNPLSKKSYGDAPFNLMASSTSGLSITYTSSDPSVASISGSSVSILKAGTTIITASQTGNTLYNPAPNVFQLLTISKVAQAINFNLLSSRTFGDIAFDFAATSTSGLPVSYSSSDVTVASISGNKVTILKPGTITITASQSGDTNFLPAADVKQTLTINKANQTLVFSSLTNKTLGDPQFNLTASSSSGLTISYSASPSDRITIVNNQVTLVKAGRVTFTASQAGDLNYHPAASVDQSFCINPPKPTVVATNVNTASPTLTSSSISGNQWFLNNAAIGSATNQTLNVIQSGIYKVQVKADDCLSEFSLDQNLVITGDIKNYSTNSSIEVFPSPVNDWLTISFSDILGKKEVSICQIDGRTKDSQNTLGGEAKFQVADYSSGIYIVKVLTENAVTVKRFVKQ